MALRIGLFQFELSHPNQAPHVGMSLLVPDLLADGHTVEAALVARGHVGALLARLEARRYDLVGLDAVFPIDVVRRIKESRPELPIVVGGTNALALFLASPADFAVVGPGRRAMRLLARALGEAAAGARGGRDATSAAGGPPAPPGERFARVPNLFFRSSRSGGGGAIVDHSGCREPWDLEAELLPYRPHLDWDYLGEGRAAAANLQQLSVVQEFGCVYQQDALASGAFGGLERGAAAARLLPDLELTPRAAAAVQPFIDNSRGCSFCVFRFQDLVQLDADRTIALVVQQLRHLQSVTGARAFSLQSENPFRILERLIERLAAEGPALETLLIRTLPLVLLHKERQLRRSLEAARARGLRLVLQQVGFESFDDRHLQLFNKGISAADNRAVARLLTALAQEYGETLDCFSGHGLILFDPWTTLDDLARNVAIVDAEAPFLARAVGLQSRLVFYDPFNPIFRKAREEGLAVRSGRDFGWDFRFADSEVADFVQMVTALKRHVAKRLEAADGAGCAGGDRGPLPPAGANSRGVAPFEGWIFRRALAAYLQCRPAAERLRAAFFAIGARLDRMLEQGMEPPPPAAEPFRLGGRERER